MMLKKGGLVYEVLKWYGYPDWRLEEGISLCKTFWSIILGIILLAPAAVWVLVAAGVTLIVLREVGASWREALIALAIALGSLVGLFGIVMGFVALFRVWSRKFEASNIGYRAADSVFDVVAIIGSFIKATKQRACPTIRFGA